MARGKKGTPENEIEDAAKRIKRYPEHLRAASSSKEWNSFLLDIGINQDIVESDKGNKFWQKVRVRIIEDETGYTEKGLAEQGIVRVAGIYRGAGGKFTTTPTDKPVLVFRSYETGKFVSPKNIERR